MPSQPVHQGDTRRRLQTNQLTREKIDWKNVKQYDRRLSQPEMQQLAQDALA